MPTNRFGKKSFVLICLFDSANSSAIVIAVDYMLHFINEIPPPPTLQDNPQYIVQYSNWLYNIETIGNDAQVKVLEFLEKYPESERPKRRASKAEKKFSSTSLVKSIANLTKAGTMPQTPKCSYYLSESQPSETCFQTRMTDYCQARPSTEPIDCIQAVPNCEGADLPSSFDFHRIQDLPVGEIEDMHNIWVSKLNNCNVNVDRICRVGISGESGQCLYKSLEYLLGEENLCQQLKDKAEKLTFRMANRDIFLQDIRSCSRPEQTHLILLSKLLQINVIVLTSEITVPSVGQTGKVRLLLRIAAPKRKSWKIVFLHHRSQLDRSAEPNGHYEAVMVYCSGKQRNKIKSGEWFEQLNDDP
jgi:hypothetical protein